MNSPTWKKRALELDLESLSNHVAAVGPVRVIVDGEGLGMSPRRAAERSNYEPPTVVFIRNDGWTLGAPAKYERIARALYEGSWAAILRGPNFEEIEDLRGPR